MLENYKRKSNIAGIIWFITMICFVIFLPKDSGSNTWEGNRFLSQISFITGAIAWFYALWAYAKAKGRSGFWSIAGILNLLGLVILLVLPDKYKKERP